MKSWDIIRSCLCGFEEGTVTCPEMLKAFVPGPTLWTQELLWEEANSGFCSPEKGEPYEEKLLHEQRPFKE